MIKKFNRRFLSIILSGAFIVSCFTGCGEEKQKVVAEQIQLLEPTGVAVNYELAAKRNMYDAKIYSGLVCPYAEEFSIDHYVQFAGYNLLPGDSVKKGDTVVLTNTDSLNDQIKAQEKKIAEAENNFQEYLKDMKESLEKPKETERIYSQALENWAKEKPEEYITQINESGQEELVQNPEFTAWAQDNTFYDMMYRDALISVQKLEENIRQQTALYELDSEYNQLVLKRLQEDKKNNTLISGMNGVITSVKLMNINYGISADTPLVAVADVDRKRIRCDYISKAEITRAESVYAIINGKHYEVEYEPMEVEEYNRLQKSETKVYTTFYLPEEASEVELGSYATIVVIKKTSKDTLTVPQDAISREEGMTYVYVLKDGESVYTPVKVGMQDGVYTEILSGIEEGDKILTEQAVGAVTKTSKLTTGKVSHEFSERGYLAYPTQEWICNPVKHGTAYLEKICVDLYQQVEKGDVLAIIRVTPDNVELSRNEKRLQRETERLAELKKNSKDNEKAIAAKEKYIQEIQETIDEMKKDFATTEIKSPYSGIITELNWWIKEGDILNANHTLVMLADQNSNYIVVEDKNGLLTYGNQAKIEYDAQNNKTAQASGMVVTLNQASISKELVGDEGYALIKVSSEDIGNMAGSAQGYDGWWSRSRFRVTVTTRNMENVVLVPKKAVTTNANATYVKIVKENGEVMYQSFVAGGSDNVNYWVAEGLTEGMEICIE